MTITTRIIGSSVDTLNAMSFGAINDGVQAGNGALSGTDNSSIFEPLFTLGSTSKAKIIIPSGNYVVNAGIFPSGTNLSNLWVEGSGTANFFVTKTSGSVFKLIGTRDAINVYSIYLTVAAPAFSRTITVNSTATMTAGQTIVLKDNSQTILSDGVVVALLGEVNQVYSIDSATQITLAGDTQYAYGASVTPSLSTSVHRWNNPAKNITLANLNFVLDPNLSYSNVGILMDFQNMQNLILENVTTLNGGGTKCNLSDVIGARIDGLRCENAGGSDDYILKIGNASADVNVNDYYATYGRHAFTSGNLASAIECAFLNFRNCEARYTSLTAWDHHPGARDTLFDHVVAVGSGDFGTASGHGIGAGIDMRGRNCTAINPRITGYYTGINMAFGAGHNRVKGGEIEGCQYGATIVRQPYAEMVDMVWRNIGVSALSITDGSDLGTGLPQLGLKVQGRLEGDCSAAAAALVTGSVGSDWQINIDAPDVTHGRWSGGLGDRMSPRFPTGDLPARVSTDGTDTTPSVTETYIAEVLITEKVVINGLSFFNGTAVSGNIKGYLADYIGNVVAATASTAQAGIDSYQRLPLTSVYLCTPGKYYVCLQVDNTTARFNTHTFGDFGASKKTSTTYGTLTTITVPTTFLANLGPIATVY